jgi:phage FluMu protein Com
VARIHTLEALIKHTYVVYKKEEVYKERFRRKRELGDSMPQKILCRKCNEVLYMGDLLKSPQDIIKKFEGKCPVCKNELNFNTDEVSVSPCNNTT